jgi:hypothetical protein
MVSKPHTLTGWKRATLNVFIAFNFAALFFWGLPDGPFRKYTARPFEKYVVYMGLWHIWGMFAPKPLDINFDVRATVKYQDGTTKEWIAPRMEELPIAQRVPKERFRKWRERIRSEEYMMIWDDTAHWIARQVHRNPQNPPVEVKMARWWTEIPPPDLKQDYQPPIKNVTFKKSYTYATFPIAAKDLQ